MKFRFYIAGIMGVVGKGGNLICLLPNASTKSRIRDITNGGLLSEHRPYLVGLLNNFEESSSQVEVRQDKLRNFNFFWDIRNYNVEIGEGNSLIYAKNRVEQALNARDPAPINPSSGDDQFDLYWLGLMETKLSDKFASVDSITLNGHPTDVPNNDLISKVIFRSGSFGTGSFPVVFENNRDKLLIFGSGEHRQTTCVTPFVEIDSGGSNQLIINARDAQGDIIDTLVLKNDTSEVAEFCVVNTEIDELLQPIIAAPGEIEARLFHENYFYEILAKGKGLKKTSLEKIEYDGFEYPVLPIYTPWQDWLNPQDDGSSPPALITCRPKLLLGA